LASSSERLPCRPGLYATADTRQQALLLFSPLGLLLGLLLGGLSLGLLLSGLSLGLLLGGLSLGLLLGGLLLSLFPRGLFLGLLPGGLLLGLLLGGLLLGLLPLGLLLSGLSLGLLLGGLSLGLLLGGLSLGLLPTGPLLGGLLTGRLLLLLGLLLGHVTLLSGGRPPSILTSTSPDVGYAKKPDTDHRGQCLPIHQKNSNWKSEIFSLATREQAERHENCGLKKTVPTQPRTSGHNHGQRDEEPKHCTSEAAPSLSGEKAPYVEESNRQPVEYFATLPPGLPSLEDETQQGTSF